MAPAPAHAKPPSNDSSVRFFGILSAAAARCFVFHCVYVSVCVCARMHEHCMSVHILSNTCMLTYRCMYVCKYIKKCASTGCYIIFKFRIFYILLVRVCVCMGAQCKLLGGHTCRGIQTHTHTHTNAVLLCTANAYTFMCAHTAELNMLAFMDAFM